MASTDPRRGEVWLVAFGAARRGEPGKHRPAIIVSADGVLTGSLDEPVVAVPLSSSAERSPLRPEIGPVAGVDRPSYAICGAVRGMARSRFLRRLGALTPEAVADVDRALALMLGLERLAAGSRAAR
jgi:mRNA interferase MazF